MVWGDWDEWSDCLSFVEVGGGVGVIGTSGATAFPLERWAVVWG